MAQAQPISRVTVGSYSPGCRTWLTAKKVTVTEWANYDVDGKRVRRIRSGRLPGPKKFRRHRGSGPAWPRELTGIEYRDVHAIDQPDLRKTQAFSKIAGMVQGACPQAQRAGRVT